MLDSDSSEKAAPNPMETLREADWKELHDRLCSISRRRIALEAEEARYLVEAEETQLYRRLSYTSMIEYMDRELNYGPHAARERLRVAHELLNLPLIAKRFRRGKISFSAVRELTRVATPETEEAFLRKADGKPAHHVQQMVAGLKRGDEPDAKPDPALIRKRVVIEVSIETHAMWQRTRSALEDELGHRLSEDTFIQMLCRSATEPAVATDEVPSPAVQTAVTTCKLCKQSFLESVGEALPINAATAARLTCDSEHIGDLESDELTRVTSAIPAALRRKVFQRDHFACAVTGCRSRRFLEVHHITHREEGGTHSMGNLMVACFGCHQRHHEGGLKITGRAPDRLVFTWVCDSDVPAGTKATKRERVPAGTRRT